jgi:hypothetical protein
MADAYTAALSLDHPGPQTPANNPVRFALLDVNDDAKFDEKDLSELAAKVFPNTPPGTQDWSREDLNGDGFTGGDGATPFDLNTTGSTRGQAPSLTTVPQTVHDTTGNPVQLQLDEHKATDGDVLCYYAYSPLYTGDTGQRDTILGNRCAPVEIVSCSTSTDIAVDASVPSDTTGGDHKLVPFNQTVPQCSPSLSLAPHLTASDAGTCNVPTKMPCSAHADGSASIVVNATANSRGATLRVSFTGTSSASISTGGSAHADVDGNSGIRLQVNAPSCQFNASGTVSNTSTTGGSAPSSVSFSGGASGTLLHVSAGTNTNSGPAPPGTYSLIGSGEASASPFDASVNPSSSGQVSDDGSVTITC